MLRTWGIGGFSGRTPATSEPSAKTPIVGSMAVKSEIRIVFFSSHRQDSKRRVYPQRSRSERGEMLNTSKERVAATVLSLSPPSSHCNHIVGCVTGCRPSGKSGVQCHVAASDAGLRPDSGPRPLWRWCPAACERVVCLRLYWTGQSHRPGAASSPGHVSCKLQLGWVVSSGRPEYVGRANAYDLSPVLLL